MLSNIEFSTRPDGEVEVRETGSNPYILTENNREIIGELYIHIQDTYPKAFAALSEKYSKSSHNKRFFEFLIARRFIKCNWSQLDNVSDIDEDGKMNCEFTFCPLRGECNMHKVVCEPEKTSKFTPSEMNVIRLIAKGMQTREIAEELFISPNTVDNHRNNMLKKIGVNNIAGLINYYNELH